MARIKRNCVGRVFAAPRVQQNDITCVEKHAGWGDRTRMQGYILLWPVEGTYLIYNDKGSDFTPHHMG